MYLCWFAKIYAIVYLRKQLLRQPVSNRLETGFCFSLTDNFSGFYNILLKWLTWVDTWPNCYVHAYDTSVDEMTSGNCVLTTEACLGDATKCGQTSSRYSNNILIIILNIIVI